MWEYIVLGQVPGTNLQIGFYGFIMIFVAVYTGRLGMNLKHSYAHKQKSILLAKTAVAGSVLRPDPEPIQLELL